MSSIYDLGHNYDDSDPLPTYVSWDEVYICRGCGKNIAEEINSWRIIDGGALETMPHLICVLRRQAKINKERKDNNEKL